MTSASDEQITPALQALLVGDAEGLRSALQHEPSLVNASWNDNTLLEWATQPPHGVEPACIQVLMDAGADLDRALGLAGCWDLAEMCTQLLAAGADPTSFADNESPITPLESAAMHGSASAADVLVTHGLHRRTLWLAAATGQLDLVTAWVSPGGRLTRPAGGYRPNWAHVGRPESPPPSPDDATVLAEALTLAAANGRIEIVDHLLGAGVLIDSAPYRGITSLHFAIQFAKTAMVEHLIKLGASLTAIDGEWGATPSQWAEECSDGSSSRQAILAALLRPE